MDRPKTFWIRRRLTWRITRRSWRGRSTNNKETESNIGGEERQLTKIRESLAKNEEEKQNLEGEWLF